MDAYSSHREVEKVKRPTVTDRHQELRNEAHQIAQQLQNADMALHGFGLGPETLLRSALQDAIDFVQRVTRELRGGA